MSAEKSQKEAKRWFITATDDFDTAKILKLSAKYAHSCFHAQQAGEKALKSLWYFIDSDPWGHSIKMLIHGISPFRIRTPSHALHTSGKSSIK